MTVEHYVSAWMRRFDWPTNTPEDTKVLPLLARLVSEEAKEVDDEFNKFFYHKELDLRALAKELGDTIWVCLLAMYTLGIPPQRVMSSIYESNMSKLDNNGEVLRDEGGKIQKGPNYKPANLDWMLEP